MTHDDANELLAALALDALDDDLRREVEAHVVDCAACQAEIDGLREVASALGTTTEAPPADLWDRIADRLYEREGAESDAPVLQITAVPAPARVGTDVPRDTLAPVVALASARSRRRRALATTLAAAAAAAIVVLGLNLSSADTRASNLQDALSRSSQSAVLAALTTPGHKVVTLANATTKDVAKFVILPDGRGFLVSSHMPTLTKSETYQLWGIVNGKPVSVGVMGSSPGPVDFTLASSPGPTALAVTVEPAGGSLTPAKDVVASGVV